MPEDLVKSGPSVLPAYAQRLHTLDMPAKPNPLYLASLKGIIADTIRGPCQVHT